MLSAQKSHSNTICIWKNFEENFSTAIVVKPPSPKKFSNPHIPKGKKNGEIDLQSRPELLQ